MEQMRLLLQAHEELLQVSKKKTDVMKTGQIDRLSEVLLEERKLVQTVAQVEEARMKTTVLLYKQLEISSENSSLQELVSYMKEGEKKQFLFDKMTRLIEVITSLKTNETLNKQLIEQSMQFVQLSLDMMEPRLDQMNYSDQKAGTGDRIKRSVFDSKA